MMLIDTNIISEMMKPLPARSIVAWLDQQNVMELFISSITIAEIAYGLNILPEGNKRNFLEDAFNKAINEAFEHRILPFDEKAAHAYGNIMGQRKRVGQPMSLPDGQIAAIAQVHGSTIVTRNVCDFENCGLTIINPFELS